MARKPKRPVKRKALRSTRTRRAQRSRRPAVKVRDPLDDFILAAARALGLPAQPKWLPAIRTNLRVTLGQAALVAEFSLPDDAEPAPVFKA
jgi:hypothetical protein